MKYYIACYSCLSASMGFNCAALYAGNIPKIKPIAALDENASNTIELEYSNVYSNKYDNFPNVIPIPTPNIPPRKLNTNASIKN